MGRTMLRGKDVCADSVIDVYPWCVAKERTLDGTAVGGMKCHRSVRLWALAWSWAITGVAAWCIVVTTWWAVAAERRAVATWGVAVTTESTTGRAIPAEAGTWRTVTERTGSIAIAAEVAARAVIVAAESTASRPVTVRPCRTITEGWAWAVAAE